MHTSEAGRSLGSVKPHRSKAKEAIASRKDLLHLVATRPIVNGTLKQAVETRAYYKYNGELGRLQVGFFDNHRLQGLGIETEFREDGTVELQRQGDFNGGVLQGPGILTAYSTNGKLKWLSIGSFVNDLFEGPGKHIQYGENGTKVAELEGTYKKGSFEGSKVTLTSYGLDGGAKVGTKTGQYQNGDFKGFLKQIQYRNNGTLEWELIGMYENRAFIEKAAMKICYEKDGTTIESVSNV